MTPAEELREAAKVLRCRSEAATRGPWTAHADGLVWPEMLGDPACGAGIVENADYIATMDPLVGTALAELLDVLSWFPSQADPTDLFAAGKLARLILGGEPT